MNKSINLLDPQKGFKEYEIIPGCGRLWDEYVQQTCDYIIEFWPEVIAGKDRNQFIREQTQILKERYSPENRIYYLWMYQKEFLVLANGYLDDLPFGTNNSSSNSNEHENLNKNPKVFYIAEMVVNPKYRGQKIGEKLLSRLITWAKQHNAIEMVVEVDTKMQANRFWNGKFGLKLESSSNDRNMYKTKL
ncbi:MAG: GNAT family N-acetyltransferase [Oligoflexia bacterium]|nr:GNAT family N-acetyltransferase [Oligoflexia bacterium]